MGRLFWAILAVVLWLGAWTLHAGEAVAEIVPAQSTVPDTPEKATPDVDHAVQQAQREIRDPFETPYAETKVLQDTSTQPAGAETPVELQGIGLGSRDAYAVIGGEVFYLEDQKNGIKLLEVRRREVDVLVNEVKMTVPLFPDDDLKKAKERKERKRAASAAFLVPIPINFNEVEIGAIPTAVHEKKIKVGIDSKQKDSSSIPGKEQVSS